jgi:hypothetical protein
MSYILEKFGSLYLSQIMATTDVGAGGVISKLIRLPGGGAYNALGRERARGNPIRVNHSCILDGSSPAEVQVKLDALKGMVGVWDKLYRLLPDGSRQFVTAVLTDVTGTRKIENRNYQPVSLNFQSTEYYWHGNTTFGLGWNFDHGYNFDEGMFFDRVITCLMPAANDLTMLNNGNYPVRNPVIVITAAGTDITELTIKKAGQTDLKYAGTIYVGKSLVIDCGAFTILNDGVDSYSVFTREANHVIAEWFCVDPGLNTVSLTRTGGDSSTISFVYDDGWV